MTYRNIFVTGPRQPRIFFAGTDAQHRITGVTIKGFFLNGKDVTKGLAVTRNDYADEPVLKASVERSPSHGN